MIRIKASAVLGTAVAAVLVLAGAAHAGPDAAQRHLIERAQKAQDRLAAAQAACGAEREKLIGEHSVVMQEVVAQMRKAKPGEGMNAAEMREWIDEHLDLMQKMMWQMAQHHRMLDPAGGSCGSAGK